MYLEQILDDLICKQEKILNEIEELKKTLKLISEPRYSKFVSLKQLIAIGIWPYTEMATRKMIQRKKLKEGYHYQKIDNRYIFSKPALVEYLENQFHKKVS